MEALSSRPLQYQWYFIGVPIAHGTQPTLTVATDSQFRGGGYYVIVSDGIDAVQSRIVMGLTQTFPIVTQQPESVRAREGSTVTFTVAAIAKGPLSYRWEGSVPLPPGTITSDPTLTLTNISQADAGRYWAWLADAEGQGSSIGAELSILPEIISTNPSYQAALAAGTNAYSTIGYGPALTVLLSHPNGSSVAPNGDVYFANTGR